MCIRDRVRAVPRPFFHSSEGMVEKHQSTEVLPLATYSLEMATRWLVVSLALWKGITKPRDSAMAVVPSSEVTHQLMKSRVAWMSSGEAFLLTHQ